MIFSINLHDSHSEMSDILILLDFTEIFRVVLARHVF